MCVSIPPAGLCTRRGPDDRLSFWGAGPQGEGSQGGAGAGKHDAEGPFGGADVPQAHQQCSAMDPASLLTCAQRMRANVGVKDRYSLRHTYTYMWGARAGGYAPVGPGARALHGTGGAIGAVSWPGLPAPSLPFAFPYLRVFDMSWPLPAVRLARASVCLPEVTEALCACDPLPLPLLNSLPHRVAYCNTFGCVFPCACPICLPRVPPWRRAYLAPTLVFRSVSMLCLCVCSLALWFVCLCCQ